MKQRALKSVVAVMMCMAFAELLCRCGFPEEKDPEIEAVLQKAGRLISAFWNEIPTFNCTESVSQEKIAKNGKIEFHQDTVFDYLVLTKTEDEDLTIEEVRLPVSKLGKKPGKPSLLSTNGFPTLWLIFHPLHQSNYRFRMEPGSENNGSWHIRFEHIRGARATTALMIRGRLYPLDLEGTASIDPATGAIQAINATLIAPMKDINIEKFRVEIEYEPQAFPPDPSTKWLPSRSVIEIRTALQCWRNIHFYSRYKRFSVQAVDRTSM